MTGVWRAISIAIRPSSLCDARKSALPYPAILADDTRERLYIRCTHGRTRPATARTWRGPASQIAPADSALHPIAIQKARV